MPLDELTITISGQDRPTVEALRAGLENALDMLHSLEKEFTLAGMTVRWEIVRVRMQSPLRLTFAPRVHSHKGRPRKSIGRNIVKSLVQGIETMENSPSSSAPPHFSVETMRSAQRMVKAATKEGSKITFSTDKTRKVTLTDNTIRNIDELVAKARKYTDVSTVEGNLEVVSAHGRPSIFVWETLTNHKVECFVKENQISQCLSLFGKRVSVTGEVSYKDHIPQSIDVELIEALPGMDQIIRLEDIPPIDITGGLPSEDHVRRMRNG